MLVTVEGIVTVARFAHPANEFCPMVVMPSAIAKLVSLLQPENAFCPTLLNVDGNETLSRFAQLANA